MVEQEKEVYAFGFFRLHVKEQLLLRDGKVIPLPPKAFEALNALVTHPGKVLSKEELMKRLWPDTFVEEGNLTQNISVLRKVLGASRESGQYIETIPRRGYRFVAPVRVGADDDEKASTAEEPSQAEASGAASSRKWAYAALAACVTVSVFLAGAYWHRFSISQTAPVKAIKTVAVLPLKNIGGEAQDNYLADGITDELITKLTKLKSVRVVSYATVSRFQGSSLDGAAIGKTLGVDAVVQGTVRKSGNRFRMAVHLIDAKTGYEIWADDRFENDFHNLLDTQRRFAEAVAERLTGRLKAQDRASLSKSNTGSVDAFETFLRGRDYLWKAASASSAESRQSNQELALRMFDRAIELDPGFADAYAWRARALSGQHTFQFGNRKTMQTAIQDAKRALALDPTLIVARGVLTYVYWLTGRPEACLEEVKRVRQTDAESIEALNVAANAYFLTGMLDRALPLAKKVFEAEPSNEEFRERLADYCLRAGQFKEGMRILEPLLAVRRSPLSAILLYLELGRWDRATEVAIQHVEAFPTHAHGWFLAGSAFVAAGQLRRANEIWANGARHLQAHFATFENGITGTALSLIYAKLNRYEEALEQIRRTLQRYPDVPTVYLYVGAIHAIRGNRREAVRYLYQAMDGGFVSLPYIEYAERPWMFLYNLRGDPEYELFKKVMTQKIDALRSRY